MEDSTDEQLRYVMSQVGERARESSRKAQTLTGEGMVFTNTYAQELYGH